MTFLGTTCGKIQTRKIKNGFSHNLMLVKNKRNRMTGKPEFEIIFNFGSIRSYNIKKQNAAMWKKINLVLDTLAADGRIYYNDAERAKSKFQEILGVPVPTLPPVPKTSAPVPAKPKTLNAEERLWDKFGDLL
jgi:hypothetical protein